MKSFKLKLNNYLIGSEASCPFQIQKAFAEIFVNTELISLIENIIEAIKDDSMKEAALLKLRKLIKQTPRIPTLYLQKQGHDFLTYLEQIKDDQKQNNPLKWVDAELEFITSKRIAADRIKGKTWWNVSDMKVLMGISKSTLYKRTGDGMPGHKIGDDLLFIPDEVDAWIRSKAY